MKTPKIGILAKFVWNHMVAFYTTLSVHSLLVIQKLCSRFESVNVSLSYSSSNKIDDVIRELQ